MPSHKERADETSRILHASCKSRGARYAVGRPRGLTAARGRAMNDEQLHGHLLNQQGSRHSLNTPALVIDLEALTRNIARMADFARTRGLQLRPHAKTHKSPDIAKPPDRGRRRRDLLRQD